MNNNMNHNSADREAIHVITNGGNGNSKALGQGPARAGDAGQHGGTRMRKGQGSYTCCLDVDLAKCGEVPSQNTPLAGDTEQTAVFVAKQPIFDDPSEQTRSCPCCP
jgi:hypothetical protein